MKVNEIFYSVQGEGSHAGVPMVFVRLCGCNYSCSWCDTTYHNEGREISLVQVRDEILKYPCNTVEFTGGEPLLQMGEVAQVAGVLRAYGYTVLVETNNSLLPSEELRSCVDTFIVDFKGPSSKVPWTYVQDKNAGEWLHSDEIKFVVADDEDIRFVEWAIAERLQRFEGKIFLSPVWGRMSFQQLAEVVKTFGLDSRVRMQLQMHKLIWDVNKRGV